VTERAIVQGIPGQRRACKLHKCVAQCRVAQRRVKWCEMHGDVALEQRSEREHLVTAGRASASEYVSSPTKRSVGSFFVLRVAGATTLGRSVACRTFRRYRIEYERKPFLLRRSVEKWQQEIAKNSNLGTSAGLGNME